MNTIVENDLGPVLTGEDIKTLSTRLKLSQRAFAESIGISQSSVTSYENGRRAIPSHVMKKIQQLPIPDVPTEAPVLTAEDIKKLRAKLGLSQKALADSLSISQSSVALYESGKRNVPAIVMEKIRQLPIPDGDKAVMTGEDIKKLKTKLGLTWRAFAESIGISMQSVWLYVSGRRSVPAHVMEKIQKLPISDVAAEPTEAEMDLGPVQTGEDIKALRSRFKLSQSAFAKAIGISTSAVGMYEIGKRTVPYHVKGKIKQRYNH